MKLAIAEQNLFNINICYTLHNFTYNYFSWIVCAPCVLALVYSTHLLVRYFYFMFIFYFFRIFPRSCFLFFLLFDEKRKNNNKNVFYLWYVSFILLDGLYDKYRNSPSTPINVIHFINVYIRQKEEEEKN